MLVRLRGISRQIRAPLPHSTLALTAYLAAWQMPKGLRVRFSHLSIRYPDRKTSLRQTVRLLSPWGANVLLAA